MNKLLRSRKAALARSIKDFRDYQSFFYRCFKPIKIVNIMLIINYNTYYVNLIKERKMKIDLMEEK